MMHSLVEKGLYFALISLELESWLRNDELLASSSSTVFLLGKKIFTKTDEIHLLTIPPFLREILYHQVNRCILYRKREGDQEKRKSSQIKTEKEKEGGS